MLVMAVKAANRFESAQFTFHAKSNVFWNHGKQCGWIRIPRSSLALALLTRLTPITTHQSPFTNQPSPAKSDNSIRLKKQLNSRPARTSRCLGKKSCWHGTCNGWAVCLGIPEWISIWFLDRLPRSGIVRIYGVFHGSWYLWKMGNRSNWHGLSALV